MMHTEFDGMLYRWNYDGLMGVGNFERKADGATTYLETGSDCQDIRESLKRLEARETPARFTTILDSLASEYAFHTD